jgi:hypothetical protein
MQPENSFNRLTPYPVFLENRHTVLQLLNQGVSNSYRQFITRLYKKNGCSMSTKECIRIKILKEKICGTTHNKLVQFIQVLEGIKKRGKSLQENQI